MNVSNFEKSNMSLSSFNLTANESVVDNGIENSVILKSRKHSASSRAPFMTSVSHNQHGPIGGSKTPTRGKRLKDQNRSGGGTSRSNPNTPSGDRFIPPVSVLDNDLAHYKLLHEEKFGTGERGEGGSVDLEEQEEARDRFDALTNGLANCKILQLAERDSVRGSTTKVLYPGGAQKKTPAMKLTRVIKDTPIKILDAPEISNNFYINILDWSPTNLLAVALGSGVYLWHPKDGEITDLAQSDNDDVVVSSLKFSDCGVYIAIGFSDGSLRIYDPKREVLLRNLHGHYMRICALAWNGSLLCSGNQSGAICVHDVVSHDKRPQYTLNGHEQEICGLAFNPTKQYLASSSIDTVNVWSMGRNSLNSTPLHNFDLHVAAVKALAWHPLENSILASGGGTADKTIRLWNVNNGRNITTVDTGSQVSGIAFNAHYNEMISAHGYADNKLIIWKYPTMTRCKELTGHEGRILHLCMSPDQEIAVSASDDETIRLWEVFAYDRKESVAKRVLGEKPKPSGSSSSHSMNGSSMLQLMQCR